MTSRSWARLVLVVVVALLAAAAVLDRSRPARPTAAPEPPPAGPAVPLPGAASTAWFCAAGSSTDEGRADEEIVVANLGDAQAEALVTVMPGAGQDPVVTTLVLPARSQTRVRVGDVLAVPDPGVVVEVFGGRPVVEHLLRRGDDVALGPCAREPSTRRLFAAGTTVKGAELWLELFNPFEEDAIVDATFFTEGGFQAPEALQGLGVPRRSKVVVPVHDHVRREAHVATEVRTRVGRVVAEQTIAFDGTDGRRGLGLSVGAGAPGESWTFPYGRLVEGAGELVAVVNPDLGTTEVDVVAHLEGDAVVEPQTLAVPGRSVAVVNLAEWLPVETLHAVEVQVTGRQPVMAEGLWSYSASSGEAGVALAGGAVAPALRWAFAPGRVTEGAADWLAVHNPARTETRVALRAVEDGAEALLVETTVPPSAPVLLDLRELEVSTGAVLVLEAGQPVIGERLAFGGLASLGPGVPFAE